jgi:small subunit ribosomal protein S8
MMTDPIADMLTRIRNASTVHKKEVAVPFSKIKKAIADILAQNGYLESVGVTEDKKPLLIITLKYHGRTPAINSLDRVSKPGHRRYVKSADLGKVLNGLGMAILSTPQGVMSDADAKKGKLGGELLCEVF